MVPVELLRSLQNNSENKWLQSLETRHIIIQKMSDREVIPELMFY